MPYALFSAQFFRLLVPFFVFFSLILFFDFCAEIFSEDRFVPFLSFWVCLRPRTFYGANDLRNEERTFPGFLIGHAVTKAVLTKKTSKNRYPRFLKSLTCTIEDARPCAELKREKSCKPDISPTLDLTSLLWFSCIQHPFSLSHLDYFFLLLFLSFLTSLVGCVPSHLFPFY